MTPMTMNSNTKKMIIEAIQLKMPFNRAKNQDHMRNAPSGEDGFRGNINGA